MKSVRRLAFMVFFVVSVLLMVIYLLKDFAEQSQRIATHPKQDYIPEAMRGEIYVKPYFTLSYVEQFEIPEWVSYTLTVDMMNSPRYERDQDFNPDPEIRSGSSHHQDYKGSGYRRGHLVPSADMAWNKAAMDATFLMSNIAPMRQAFNDGIWLELEHHVRDWSRLYGKVNVVSGPVFENAITTIGENEVLVPRYFYKAVFTAHEGRPKVIAFLFNQSDSTFSTLDAYIVSVDSLEKITGLDFFSNGYGSWDKEIELESKTDVSSGTWPFQERWYQQRLDAEKKSIPLQQNIRR